MRIFLLSLFVFILVACQPGLREQRRSMRTVSSIDSTLYYPTKTIHDPFLDSLKIADSTSAHLYLTLLPPPPPPAPTFTLIDGFRIQLFAGTDSLNTYVLFNKTKNSIPDSVYFFKEAGLYKIQIGDFVIRNMADLRLLKLRQKNLTNMWVVPRKIKQPLQTNIPPETPATNNLTKNFSIQVLVTADKTRAEALIQTLHSQFNLEAYSKQKATVYKIFLGRFATHAKADSVLKTVRTKGYPDAWINKNKP